MLILRAADVRSSEITPYHSYLTRRRFLGSAAGLVVAAASGALLPDLWNPRIKAFYAGMERTRSVIRRRGGIAD
jgi:hypothetical protein